MSAVYVAQQLAIAARTVHADPNSPKWMPNGSATDKENARKYWSKVIDVSGVLQDRSSTPDQPCALPPEGTKPYSTSFKIIYIWRCEADRLSDLYLVTGGQYVNNNFTYNVEQSRYAAVEDLVNEALSVSYGASQWKTDKCDNGKDSPQGIFPMTKDEAKAAGVTDRCDVAKNIDGAANLVLSGEKVPPEKRPHDLGVFEPMVGGWMKLSIAMGGDLKVFSMVGPGKDFVASDACTKVMKTFLGAIAPHAAEFATLTDPPKPADLTAWQTKLQNLEAANNLTDPGYTAECVIGSWSQGFNSTLAQLAINMAGTDAANAANLNGLSEYYLAEDDNIYVSDPTPGQDSLVIPRLSPRPAKEIAAPIAADASDVWSMLGSNSGVSLPVSQLAIEYAWFFGGVIAPFDSAGKLIGSLAAGSGAPGGGSGPVQVTVGPDGCPENAPQNTLRQGSDQVGIHKLCVDSVAHARTPQAAIAIKWALTHLGWPYSQARRNDPGYADCSSFVSRAYRDSGAIPNLYQGNAPTTDTFRAVAWTHQITLSQAQPGDLVEPESGHVTMQLADGYKVHTNMTGDVSKVERAYSYAYWVGWVDPSKVGQ